MTPLRMLKAAVRYFEKNQYKYCLIGGHAASIYRSRERFTRDVDFAIGGKPASEMRRLAEAAINAIGLEPMAGFIPVGPNESTRKTVCMITARPIKKETTGIIDILLPILPWVEDAVERAQYNKINLGFALVPVITPEDLIIAKSYSFQNSNDRFQDLDDMKEIFETVKDIDWNYVDNKLAEFHLSIPELLQRP